LKITKSIETVREHRNPDLEIGGVQRQGRGFQAGKGGRAPWTNNFLTTKRKETVFVKKMGHVQG